jgi:hypothetical protein
MTAGPACLSIVHFNLVGVRCPLLFHRLAEMCFMVAGRPIPIFRNQECYVKCNINTIMNDACQTDLFTASHVLHHLV